uniref:NXPE C-terminal domain-containing protein n=1 Tax=Branchiostoma floridae TaxID=7739 RepID=C3YVQ1_BRAFL|eukprot:XP_002599573.1 hypothetical protein BRAFLDRAFT_279896 [Branchiostoma floridae]
MVTQNFIVSIVNPQAVYQVGQLLLIKIVAKDSKGRVKSYGGDFLRTKLYSNVPVQASTAGRVTDFKNGTYIARFFLSWPGILFVSVQLIHSSEAVQVLKRIRDTAPVRRIMVCGFLDEKRNVSEWTPCTNNVGKHVNLRDVCEYSKPAFNVSFHCQRPTRPIRCGSITVCHRDRTDDVLTLFRLDFLGLSWTGVISKQILQRHNIVPNWPRRSTLPVCAPRLAEAASEGYWFNGTWNCLRCQTRRFPSARSMLDCLQHKSLYFFGDSTTRQWWAYLTEFIGLGRSGDVPQIINIASSSSREYNVSLKYRFHYFPKNVNVKNIDVNTLGYVAEGIDEIVGGPNVVIIVGLWAHFMAEPMETFRSRVWGIRHAIERLHSRYPDTLVIWRTSNTNHHDRLSHFVENSDWYGYQLFLEVKKILEDVNVAILDVWEMSESMWHDAIMHPPKEVIKEHVNMLLSYICPA